MSEKRKPQESMQRRQQNGQQVRKPRKSAATSRVSRVSKSKKRNDNRGMIVGISLVVIMFCVILIVQTFNAYGTLSDLKKQKKELTQEYNDQLELSDELKEKEDYVKTDEYIEEMARKMGLVYPDEVIFKPED